MEEKTNNKGLSKVRFWIIVLGMGLAGQLCWNMENQWFNTFVYAKISGNVNIVSAMIIASAFVSTLSTFIFGTLSDRIGKKKMFVSFGYIIWGITTIIFGLTEYARKSGVAFLVASSGFLVVFMDCVMSFFGSMGNDCGFNAWLNDYTDDSNKGQVGAALAALPVLGTVLGTVIGGAIINIGNATAGTTSYDPSLDNYQLLFWLMGGFVAVIGALSLLLMKDSPNIKASKEGSFLKQMFACFNFKELKGKKNMKEMFLACITSCVFFIPFNFYFSHMGNWLIYDIGFSVSSMGLIEGISLLLAVVVTLPVSILINKGKMPLVVIIATICNVVGLLLTYFLVKNSSSVDVVNLFTLKNIKLFICVFLIGVGYVLMMQTSMIWVRGLFPEENRGQFEGVRILFFVLVPMLIGTLIGNIIIKNTPQEVEIYDSYNHIIDVPQENLFLFASIMALLTFIPLIFLVRVYKKRMSEEKDKK